MSERSSFISDVFFERAPADRVAAHIEGRVSSAIVAEVYPGKWVVFGYVTAGYPGGEWEAFADIPPLEGGLSLVINCDCAPPFRWRLDTAEKGEICPS